MSNSTLRERFGLEGKEGKSISKLIRHSKDLGLIEEDSTTQSRKIRHYLPTWSSLEQLETAIWEF